MEGSQETKGRFVQMFYIGPALAPGVTIIKSIDEKYIYVFDEILLYSTMYNKFMLVHVIVMVLLCIVIVYTVIIYNSYKVGLSYLVYK